MARRGQVAGHGQAHAAEADESDPCHCRSPSSYDRTEGAAALGQRAEGFLGRDRGLVLVVVPGVALLGRRLDP